MISISLVICTRNRAQQLNTCLAYIAALNTSIPWELIVVDNGSSDSTSHVLRDFARSASFPVIILNEPMPGLGRTRNRGWRAARGEIIAFTDDDCYVLPDFPDRVLEAFADPTMGYCGGRAKLYDSSDYPITINESAVSEIFPPNNYFATGVIHGANMIFRRAALVDIGGFDNCFGPEPGSTVRTMMPSPELPLRAGGAHTRPVQPCSMLTDAKPQMWSF
jgi:glycosyltransferase involved in cell wall biosynthesis